MAHKKVTHQMSRKGAGGMDNGGRAGQEGGGGVAGYNSTINSLVKHNASGETTDAKTCGVIGGFRLLHRSASATVVEVSSTVSCRSVSSEDRVCGEVPKPSAHSFPVLCLPLFTSGNSTCEATSIRGCQLLKASGLVKRCFIYHNMELALQWLESQRAVMYDPDMAGMFLQYTDGQGHKLGRIYNEPISFGDQYFWCAPYAPPPPPVSRNHLAQEPTPGSAVEFSHHFFYQGSGFFMFLVDVGQLFRWTSWMMMQSPSILTSQNPSLSLSRSQLQSPPQHRSLAPRGSTDRNSGWCIT